MKSKTTKSEIVSLFSMVLVLVLLCGVLSSVFSMIAYAASDESDQAKYELYGSKVDQNTMIMHSKLDAIYGRLNDWEDKQIAREEAASKKYEGIFKNKKTKAEKKLICKRVSDSLDTLNQQLPGIVQMIKDAQNGGDFDTASCINTSVATISSIATLCGPYGQIAASILNLGDTIFNLAMGGESATSEAAQIEDRLTQQLDEIRNDLSEIQNQINDLSDEINESTNRILAELPAALERADDKNQFRTFMLSYEGNFSYNQFRNYIYGETVNNSSSSTAYYGWLKNALVSDSSEESIRRYYDDLYYAITNNIGSLKDYLAPGDDSIKSIVRTYYDYVSSNLEFESIFGITPEEATIQFAYEVYQTEMMADIFILICNNYQYTQMLLDGRDYYESYNGSFTVHEAEILDRYINEIEPREDEISKQIAEDIIYVLGLDSFYLIEEEDGTFYEVIESDDAYYNVVSSQTIYLNQMSQTVCELFDIDIYDYSYTVNSVASDGYFKVTTSDQDIRAELKYQDESIQTMTFSANSSSRFIGGDGSKNRPYLVSTKEQFLRIGDDLGKHYCLTRSINLEGITIAPFGYEINDNGGEKITEFTGTLNGNGYVLSNATIKGGTMAGLFCKLDIGATVENLTVSEFKVESNLSYAEHSYSQFSIGTIAGENNGKIKNCVVTGNDSLNIGVFFTLNNSTHNRSVYAYVGGIAGVNNNLISSCKVEKTFVIAESNHSFGGDSTKSNKNNVYVGGLTGYNNGLLGYSSVDANSRITAKAVSTLSPKTTVNPYVEALAGGICGKIGSDVSTSDMSKLYSAAKTLGNGTIKIVDSRWGEHYSNRKQNGYFVLDWENIENPYKDESQCYIPGFNEDKTAEINCSESDITAFFDSMNHPLDVDISGIKTTYKADDFDFVYTDMVISVAEKTAPDTVYEVATSSVLNIYGFLPYNSSFVNVKQKQAVILIQLTLKDGRSLITKKTIDYSVDRNAIISVEVEQSEKKFYADISDTQIPMSELNGLDNVKFNCYVNSYTGNFDSEKLTDYTVKVDKCVRCEECGSYNVSSSVIGNNIAYECKEDSCHHTGFVAYKTYDSLYKGEIGKYRAFIEGIYDGQTIEIEFDYTVYCPHVADEEHYLVMDCVIAPTCASLGYTQYHCTHCGEVLRKSYTSKTDVHVYEYIADDQERLPSAPTCYEEGFTGKIVCSLCGEVKDEGHSIPKLEHDYCEIVYIYDGAYIMLDEQGNKVSYQHKCTHAEKDGSFHYENHQYKVTESVLPRTNDKGETEYYVVYTYSCDCGYSKQITDENLIVDENSSLPTVMVSNGYAVNGSDEVVVYVQLLNNPGIAGANFGIRYDSRLKLKEYVYGDISEQSITKDSNEVNFGYNFVWAGVDYHTESGNLLKLVFIVPSDAVKGDEYNVSIVYNIENGASGGFTVNGKTQCFITRDAKITIVERLPGDVNNDGVVDLLDAIEIGQFLVNKKESIDEKYANVDLSNNQSNKSNVTISDMVIILQSMTGGYGVNLLSQEFQVVLNGNGYNLADGVLNVSIYNEYNNTYNRAGLKDLEQKGYKFDGWWTKLVGGEQIILADGSETRVQYFNFQKQQTLYAHWTLNSVTLNGNGATNDITAPKLSYSEDYHQGSIQNHFEQEYKVTFVDTSKVSQEDSVNKTLQYSLIGWALSAEDANNKVIKYKADLSDLNLEISNLGDFVLYAVWDDGNLAFPTWNKSSVGYQDVQWFSNFEKSSLLNTSDAKASNAIIKSLAVKTGTGDYIANVYAGFKPITYTIYFDSNGGDGTKLAESNHNVEYSSSLNKNSSISRIGYQFVGWSLTPDGKAVYDDGASVGYIQTPVSQADGTYSLTLYAVWIPYKYGINYNMNIPDNALKVKNGTKEYSTGIIVDQNLNKDEKPIYEIGKEYTLPSNTYSILGWNFIGWSKNKDGSGEIFKNCEKVLNLTSCEEGNETITLYAVWEVDPYAIGKNVNNGDIITNTQGTLTYIVYNDITKTPQSTQAGYIYVNDWSSCTGDVNYIDAVKLPDGTRYGGGNFDHEIVGTTEVYFIGQQNVVFENMYIMPKSNEKSSDDLNIHFVNFNARDSNIQFNTNDSILNLNNSIILNIVGQCVITAPLNKEAIFGFTNIIIKGTGTLTVTGGNGTNGLDATTNGAKGANGVDGYAAIVCDHLIIDMDDGTLAIKGGNGGTGGKGYQGIKGSSGDNEGWGSGGNGGTGGAGGAGGAGGTGGSTILSLNSNLGHIEIKQGLVILTSGDGGAGGDGGKGGTGGKGGKATAWLQTAGNGGTGGTGGKGGSAGTHGQNKTSIIISKIGDYRIIIGDNGQPGDGGAAGDGGAKGKWDDLAANDGSSGAPGKPGEKGTVPKVSNDIVYIYSNGIKYLLLSNDTLEVCNIGTSTDTDIVLPETVNGRMIKRIGDRAFTGNVNITNITIPYGVVEIGENAFQGCSNLISVTIPEGVISIGDKAFYGCSSLLSLTIPSSIVSIGNQIICKCSGLSNIKVNAGNAVYHSNGNCLIDTVNKTLLAGCKNSVIPSDGSVTFINAYAFYCCGNLTDIVIPLGVTNIGSYAFYGCTNLTSIHISSSVTNIGERALSSCRNLISITVENGNTVYQSIYDCLITSENKTLVAGCKNSVIPTDGSVTCIGNYAFYDCGNLTDTVIPSCITTIGKYAFYGCNGLKNITIPASTTSIGTAAFSKCEDLISINVESGNTIYQSFGNCLIKTNTKVLIAGCQNSIIPTDGSVTSIGDLAFYGCGSLKTIHIPASVTKIGVYAFGNCSNLSNVIFENNSKWFYYRRIGIAKVKVSFGVLSNAESAAKALVEYYYGVEWIHA